MPAKLMRTGYTYTVKEVAPQMQPSVSGLTSSAERQFILPCQYAQDFGLRALGKFYNPAIFETPELPVEYPIDTYNVGTSEWTTMYPQQVRLRAVGFRVEPPSDKCFNNDYVLRDGESFQIVPGAVEDISSVWQLSRHWKMAATSDPAELPIATDDPCCMCVVAVEYQEQWWQCLWTDAVTTTATEGALQWLNETAFRVDRVASYELFTRPSRSLVWDGKAPPDDQIGPDSHAVVIIPSAEVTVEWHNIPVARLCELETHLNCFRNTVNSSVPTLFNRCPCSQSLLAGENCDTPAEGTDCQYEPETLLFVDYAEDKNRRTNMFGPMDTTTLVLTFKHKRIATALNQVVGHNHLLYDKVMGAGDDDWRRVKVQGGTDMFPLKDFNKMFKMESVCPP